MVNVILNTYDIMIMNMHTTNNIDFKYILKDFFRTMENITKSTSLVNDFNTILRKWLMRHTKNNGRCTMLESIIDINLAAWKQKYANYFGINNIY